MALLEDKIKRPIHSLSHGHQHSRSHRCSGSHHWRYQAWSHQDRALRWKCTKEDHPREEPNFPALGSWEGMSLLRTTPKRTSELGSPIHLPGEMMKNPVWKRMDWGACLPLTLTWRVSWPEQNGEMTPSRCHCLSPPTIIVLSGSSGAQSSLTPQHGGKSSLRSPARVMSKSLWGGSRHHSSYPGWAAMRKRWPMTIQCHQFLTLWNGTNFYPFPIWSVMDRTANWNNPKRPWLMPRLSSIGWKMPSCQCKVSLTNWWRACWSSNEPWNL